MRLGLLILLALAAWAVVLHRARRSVADWLPNVEPAADDWGGW